MVMSFCAVLFPRGVLDEILNLIESVSEEFPSYSRNIRSRTGNVMAIKKKENLLCKIQRYRAYHKFWMKKQSV